MEGKTIVRKTWRPPLICCVCGGTARGMNFGVITCMSCKAFFRRNVLKPVGTLRCAKKFKCQVAKDARTHCPACRLKKCLALGMKPHLIRRFSEHQLPTPRPLGLLSGDRSTLSIGEWNQISNMIHMFDKLNSILSFKILLDGRSSLPLKMRSKPEMVLDCARHVAASTEMYFRRATLVYSLATETRQAFVMRNMVGAIHLNELFLLRENEGLKNTYYSMSLSQVHGSAYLQRVYTMLESLDRNGTLIKMMIFIITFSSNCSVLIYDEKRHVSNASIAIDAFAIQDTLVSILWKYLTYQYPFHEAVLRYSSLIKSLTDLVHHQAFAFNSKEVANILEDVIEETKQLLIIED